MINDLAGRCSDRLFQVFDKRIINGHELCAPRFAVISGNLGSLDNRPVAYFAVVAENHRVRAVNFLGMEPHIVFVCRFKGQLMTYVPGEGPCYRCVFKNPPPKDAVPTCKQAGVIGAMGGVIGSLQAMEAIKYILGIGNLLTGYLLTYDALTMEFRKVKRPGRAHDCAVCGDHPTILEPIDYEQDVCEETAGRFI